MSVLKYFKRKLKARLLAGEEPGWLRKHSRRAYIRGCVLSCPPWLGFYRRELDALDETKRAVTRATGRAHVLDHEIPVTHPYVCGLTVPWNLRVIDAKTNAAKSNKWHPDQVDMFLDAVEKHENYEMF